MIIYRFLRINLLLLFALLQCVAPLAHAHVNGHHADHEYDAHHLGIGSSLLSAHGYADTRHEHTKITTEQHYSAVVSMPPEYRSDERSTAQPAIAGEYVLLLPCEFVARSHIAYYLQSFPTPPYLHPASQAPPA